MNLIAQQDYVKIERKISHEGQYEVEHKRQLKLYEDKVVTEHREFPIEQVIDFSYREIANLGGILYLHTIGGLYTYSVKSSPEDFISSYKAYFS